MSSSFDAFSVDGDDLTNLNNSSSAHPFEDHSYSSFDGAAYSSFSGDVAVDHAASDSPPIFSYADPPPDYSHSSPFDSVPVENGNDIGNGYGDDADFVSDGPILPPPSDMEPEEGRALREWRWLVFTFINLASICLDLCWQV